MTDPALAALIDRLDMRQCYEHPVWGKQGLFIDVNTAGAILAALRDLATVREENERLRAKCEPPTKETDHAAR